MTNFTKHLYRVDILLSVVLIFPIVGCDDRPYPSMSPPAAQGSWPKAHYPVPLPHGPVQAWLFKGTGKWLLLDTSDPAANLYCVNDKWCRAAGSDILRAPAGWKICLPVVDNKNLVVGYGATFEGVLQHGGKKPYYYYYSGVDFKLQANVIFHMIPENTGALCMGDGYVWQCGANTPAGRGKCIGPAV